MITNEEFERPKNAREANCAVDPIAPEDEWCGQRDISFNAIQGTLQSVFDYYAIQEFEGDDDTDTLADPTTMTAVQWQNFCDNFDIDYNSYCSTIHSELANAYPF